MTLGNIAYIYVFNKKYKKVKCVKVFGCDKASLIYNTILTHIMGIASFSRACTSQFYQLP